MSETTASYGDLVAAALRADAEAALEEIRATGITCPSCRVNMADLPDGHALTVSDGPGARRTAECQQGDTVQLYAAEPVPGADLEAWQAVATITVYDDFRRLEAEAFKRIVSTGPVDFTGLLDALGGKAAEA
jgi:hypothetical protein